MPGGVHLPLKPSFSDITLAQQHDAPARSGLVSSFSLSYFIRLNVDTLPLSALAWPSNNSIGIQSRFYRLTPRSLTLRGCSIRLFDPRAGFPLHIVNFKNLITELARALISNEYMYNYCTIVPGEPDCTSVVSTSMRLDRLVWIGLVLASGTHQPVIAAPHKHKCIWDKHKHRCAGDEGEETTPTSANPARQTDIAPPHAAAKKDNNCIACYGDMAGSDLETTT